MEAEPGDVVEDGVRSEKRRADVNSGSGDPQVVGVDRFMQRVPDSSACVAQLRCGGQQSVADGYNGGRSDRLLQPVAALPTPVGERAP